MAGSFLHFFEPLLQIVQLGFHNLQLPLLLALPFIPGYVLLVVSTGEANRITERIDVPLQRGNRIFHPQDLSFQYSGGRLPELSLGIALSGADESVAALGDVSCSGISSLVTT